MDTAKAGKVRSRLVAQDFNTDKGKVDELFAATPPLLVSRWLCSKVASQGCSGFGPLTVMTLDFSKAFLYGNMEREVFVELPDEDSRKHESDCVGRLLKSMYGLRDAPQIWQKVVKNMLKARGYKPLVGTQCTYVHPVTAMIIVAHVDDFLVLGTKSQLEELIAGLQSEYECSGQILGYDADCTTELKFLGRTITLTPSVIAWEGDRRHAESFLKKLTEEFAESTDKKSHWSGSRTPGVKLEQPPERTRLSAVKAKAYRGLAALANFMAQDRADIGYAAKEVSKTMSDPAECDLVAMKRLGRYLAEHPRCINMMYWQAAPSSIHCYSVSDWGGDLVSRRSTSGGCIFHGRHLVQSWSRTQQVVSLTSAEAELHDLTKAASEGLAVVNMSRELYYPLPLEVLTDSSAARGIILRSGVGKVKHLDIKILWIQERES